MSISAVSSSFNQVYEECLAQKTSKEQALALLKNRYDFNVINIKETLGPDHISFCTYVPCNFDKWVEICDGAERNKPYPERTEYDNKIQRVIDKLTAKYKENDLGFGNTVSEVYKEVHHIQNLCRENREITKSYKEIKDKIDTLPEILIEKPKIPESELIEPEKMPPLFKKLFNSKVITGEKINGRWVVRDDKHGLKVLFEWSENKNNELPTTPSYISKTFCNGNGKPFTRGSVRTYRYNNGLTGDKK